MSESTYQWIARERFPQFAIEGDGEWALVCPDTGRVLLAVWAAVAERRPERGSQAGSVGRNAPPQINTAVDVEPRRPRLEGEGLNMACVNQKLNYRSRAAAQRKADRERREHGLTLRPYRCEVCLQWHNTHLTVEEYLKPLTDRAVRRVAKILGQEIDADLRRWAAEQGREIKRQTLEAMGQ